MLTGTDEPRQLWNNGQNKLNREKKKQSFGPWSDPLKEKNKTGIGFHNMYGRRGDETRRARACARSATATSTHLLLLYIHVHRGRGPKARQKIWNQKTSGRNMPDRAIESFGDTIEIHERSANNSKIIWCTNFVFRGMHRGRGQKLKKKRANIQNLRVCLPCL